MIKVTNPGFDPADIQPFKFGYGTGHYTQEFNMIMIVMLRMRMMIMIWTMIRMMILIFMGRSPQICTAYKKWC